MRIVDGNESTVSHLLGIERLEQAIDDRRGQEIRTTPTRSTWSFALADGSTAFRKHRRGRRADARAEWKWLGSLAAAGFRVPGRLLLLEQDTRSVVVMRAVPGRPLSEWILAAVETADARSRLRTYLVGPVAACVRRLHDAGFVHRDLYWNHLFAEEIGEHRPEPAIIDVERVIRPTWIRRRRWLVKDLGALLGSWPAATLPRTLALRFLRSYSGGRLAPGWKRIARAVVRRAWRIRTHRPRYGSPPIWWEGDKVRSP